ncbi:MAG: guanylate kinase [Candidatus Desulfatibia sp.]|uniref:guanylate kinase n=1 Tax=Candidatus Desulfatibia sp. TaxID=3101189 RepID=UPI002F30D76D
MNEQGDRSASSNSIEMNNCKGHLFILSAPSGAGKTTLAKAILNRFADMLYSVSYTTREPRNGEQDGLDYHFVQRDLFKKYIKEGKWAEWAEVHGNYYGTSAEFIDKNLAAGRDILLDIDVQGTIQLLERYPDSITIFIMPPSLDILRRRLELRGTDSKAVIARRLVNAKKEMARQDLYRHVIINDQLSEAIKELISTIEKYRAL